MILTLDECLKRKLMTRRIFNRLRVIETNLVNQCLCTSLPEFLETQYHKNQKSLVAITQELKSLTQLTTGHGRLKEYMSIMGIPSLSRSQALYGVRNPNYGNRGEDNPLTGTNLSEELKGRLSIMRRGENNPFYGRTHTPENRLKMSQATKNKTWEQIFGEEKAKAKRNSLIQRQSGEKSHFYGMKGTLSPSYGRTNTSVLSCTHGGYRKDLGHFVRSTWEANVARIFLFKGESYEYEPKRFALDITGEYQSLFPDTDKTTYLPDFKNGHYYEIKGSFDLKGGLQSFAKLLMFIQQYGQELEIIDSNKYQILSREFSEKINQDNRFCGWETLSDNLKTNPDKYS
jgi:hypothetical protein